MNFPQKNLKIKVFIRASQIYLTIAYYFYNYWMTYFPINFIRLFYLRNFMKISIGRGSFIHMGCLFYENVVIGNNSIIGRNCNLLGNIIIKDNVSITAESYIFSSSHYKDSPLFEAYTKPVIIESRVWIGARSVVLPGVTLGEGAVLGANSTAVRDIPPYTVFAGTPARQIGIRSTDLEYTLHYSPYLQ
jgi:maltose O-acetyltransferase